MLRAAVSRDIDFCFRVDARRLVWMDRNAFVQVITMFRVDASRRPQITWCGPLSLPTEGTAIVNRCQVREEGRFQRAPIAIRPGNSLLAS